MTLNFWYLFFVWLPPVTAAILLLRSFRDHENQILTVSTLKYRLFFYIAVVIISWTATSWLRFYFYQHHPFAQYFLPFQGSNYYYQIIFGRLLAKVGLDVLAGLIAGIFIGALGWISRGRWVSLIDIFAAGFSGLAVGWEYALYFFLTGLALSLFDAIAQAYSKQPPSRIELTPGLLASGAAWTIIAAYQYIYVLRIYQ